MKDWVDKQLEDPEFRKDFEEELRKQQAECPHHGDCDHIWVTWEALQSYLRDDFSILYHKVACDVRSKRRQDKCYYKIIAPPEPDDPCDDAFMEEIST